MYVIDILMGHWGIAIIRSNIWSFTRMSIAFDFVYLEIVFWPIDGIKWINEYHDMFHTSNWTIYKHCAYVSFMNVWKYLHILINDY